MAKNIAVLVGSLREDSFNRKVAKQLIALAPETLNFKVVEIGQLSLYNQDLDDNPPEEWLKFREQIRNSDGVLFVTPEYNRSIPGVLKNAIDIGSRPYGESAWEKKPAAVISVSPGRTGAFGANHHLRQCLVFLDMPCMQQPEAYIGGAANLFDEKDEVKNEAIRELLENFILSFSEWVMTFSEKRGSSQTAAA